MPSERTLAPYGVVALGVVLVAVALAGVVDGSVAAALVWAGFPLVFAGALWIDVLDRRPLSNVRRRDLIVGTLLFLGWAGYLVVTADLQIPRSVRIGLGVAAGLALLGVGYVRNHREAVESYDEREIRIRYRAAYNGFLALNAVLFLGAFAVYLATTTGDEGPAYVTGVLVGSVLVMAVGILTFKVSEGWYQTRM